MSNTSSMFTQILSLFQRSDFARHARELTAERHARGFSCWSQFVAMLFCQLAQARSLREISGGLKSCEGKLKHLGLEVEPKRSGREGRTQRCQMMCLLRRSDVLDLLMAKNTENAKKTTPRDRDQ